MQQATSWWESLLNVGVKTLESVGEGAQYAVQQKIAKELGVPGDPALQQRTADITSNFDAWRTVEPVKGMDFDGATLTASRVQLGGGLSVPTSAVQIALWGTLAAFVGFVGYKALKA